MKHYLRLDANDPEFPALQAKLRAQGCGTFSINKATGDTNVLVECDESIAVAQFTGSAMLKRMKKDGEATRDELLDFEADSMEEIKAQKLLEPEKIVSK